MAASTGAGALGTLARLVTEPVSKLLSLFLRSPRFARAPISLYRAGFGWLLGSRMIMLEHTGRKSGKRRYVVLEVVGHPVPDTYIVASGLGERSQWLRNVLAQPLVRVSCGRRVEAPARARRLDPAEADIALQNYIAEHPRAWAALKGVMEQSLDGRIDPPGTELPLVELTVQAT